MYVYKSKYVHMYIYIYTEIDRYKYIYIHIYIYTCLNESWGAHLAEGLAVVRDRRHALVQDLRVFEDGVRHPLPYHVYI